MDEGLFWQEENDFEVQNRVRNLMWSVSGDYGLDLEVDTEAFRRYKYLSLYDAVRQGGFARFFDKEEFSGYLVRKVYLGAEVSVLMRFAWMCTDSAVWRKLAEDRPGVPDIRRKAFEDLLDRDFARLAATPWGRVEAEYLRRGLEKTRLPAIRISSVFPGCEAQIVSESKETAVRRGPENVRFGEKARTGEKAGSVLERILSLETASDTMAVIQCVDSAYNEVYDQRNGRKFTDLAQVLAVPDQALLEYDWKDYLDEEAAEDRAERLVNRFQEEMFQTEEDRKRRKGGGIVALDAESVEKMHSYIELNYGRSYLSRQDAERADRRICRGAHGDSSLHFTDGILAGMVKVNSQSEYARKVKEINLRVLRQNLRVTKQNIQILANVLKRALVTRTEKESCSSDYGKICPAKLWKVGRTDDQRLFEREIRRENSDFAVEVLIDASGSQRARQSQVALQGYIISEALSMAGIPHRVMGFCTFWDYTVMRRFRDYGEGREANERIFEFYGSANNRDGLAIRAAADSLEMRPEENKILIVLSDGRPNDVIVNRPHSRNPKPYCGEYAVRDTALEVRKLRNRGVAVLGVFTGKEEDLQAEKKIYGKDFAYIREIANFSNVVGRYLKKQLLD